MKRTDLLVFLRAIIGTPEDQPSPDMLAASVRRLLPIGSRDLGTAGSIAWTIMGTGLFAEGLPSLEQVQLESSRLMMALAMLRTGGNLSHAAALLGISRRTLRDGLRAASLYPWPGDDQNDENRVSVEHQREFGPMPSIALALGQLSSVVEDGTPGVVRFEPHGPKAFGPAKLERSNRSERLFRGWWVDRNTAEGYAHQYGHAFYCDDGDPQPGESNDTDSDHGEKPESQGDT